MFRIRKVHDPLFPHEARTVKQVQAIMRDRFPELSEEKISNLPEQLLNPLKFRFKTILFVAESTVGKVKGFAVLMIDQNLKFCFLDFVAVAKNVAGGLGSAIYQRVREEALELKVQGIFFECLPDDPQLCKDNKLLAENASRLKFYERFGAFPISETKYETLVDEKDDCPPYLVFDDLGQNNFPSLKITRKIVKAILQRKYGDYCPPEYIRKVVDSFNDNPFKLRAPKYIKKIKSPEIPGYSDLKIKLVINDMHFIHHVKERGYVESPVRVKSILKEIEKTGIFEKVATEDFSEHHIRKVHNPKLIHFLKKVCTTIEEGRSVYPYVFPVRNPQKTPKDLNVGAGYYCIDTFTPLNRNAWLAARKGADCALTAANIVLHEGKAAYALLRPPGHHAESKVFGGFCYLNNGAIAAQFLSGYGKVAILDIDYHHGNGQQDIFYNRSDVFTVSIHGHPSFAYPYFCGFVEEKGDGEGAGYNLNIPLEEQISSEKYTQALFKAVSRILKFKPSFLVILLGFDTAKGDPTGTWSLMANDFFNNGKIIGSLKIPSVIIQEGGYKNQSIGTNARKFFEGFSIGFTS